ncbi:MAG: light-harvesting antenna LH1, beta subunit [Pseudomonadota bacterium]
MASETPASSQSMSGLTDREAQEFHKVFISTFALFTIIALLAHLLVWIWRPWIPGTVPGSSGAEAMNTLITSAPFSALIG